MKSKFKSKRDVSIPIFAILIAILLGSCKGTEHEQAVSSIGKFVYVDTQKVLHVKKRCIGLKITDKTGISYYKPIKFLDTANVRTQHLNSLCSRCVKDEHYEDLKQLAERHETPQDTTDYSLYIIN